MKIALLSAAFPPDLDGIGDYTWWLSCELVRQGHQVSVFTSEGPIRQSPEGVAVVQFFNTNDARTSPDLASAVAATMISYDWLVVQYNPFGYGKRGFCPWLPRTLRKIRRSQPSLRIAVMFHETMVPRWPWRFALMRLWQRPIFRQMCRLSNVLFVSTERWLPEVRSARPSGPVFHLAVGSNVPLHEISQAEARRSLGIPINARVVGIFGAAHVSRLVEWIAEGAAALAADGMPSRETIVLYVGSDGVEIKKVCASWRLRVVDRGKQASSQVGLNLRAMDMLLTPFADGVSTRRGSVMAALQHGIPVATTVRSWTDGVLRGGGCPQLLGSSAETSGDFTRDLLNWSGKILSAGSVPVAALADFYQQNFSWSTIAGKMVATLVAYDEAKHC